MAFEWLSMYDLDQTISCSILRQKKIFDQLASFGNKVSSKRKKKAIIKRVHRIIFLLQYTKPFMWAYTMWYSVKQ